MYTGRTRVVLKYDRQIHLGTNGGEVFEYPLVTRRGLRVGRDHDGGSAVFFGHMPERGETVGIGDLEFEILNTDSRRLRLLRVNTPQ